MVMAKSAAADVDLYFSPNELLLRKCRKMLYSFFPFSAIVSLIFSSSLNTQTRFFVLNTALMLKTFQQRSFANEYSAKFTFSLQSE